MRQIEPRSRLRSNGQMPQFVLCGSGAGANVPTIPIILPMPGGGVRRNAQSACDAAPVAAAP